MIRRSLAYPLLLLAACAGGATGPNSDPARAVTALTHPAGTIFATTPLGARPFGSAISREQGVVMVTRLDAATVSKGQLPATSLATDISVGFIPTNVKFSQDGLNAFVTNQVSQTVGIINVATGTQVSTVNVPMSTFNLAYCKSNKRVYVTGPGTSVYIIDPATASLKDSITTNAVTNGIATDANCTRVYVSDEPNARVLEIIPGTKAIVRTFATGGAPKDLAVSPNGKRLYVADETGFIQVWNLTNGQRVTSVPLSAGAFGLAISPDGTQVYAGMPFGAGVVVLNTANNTIVKTIPTGGTPRKIAFNARGSTAVIANEAGWVDFVH